jgi:RNA polymerase sigma-70 factor (ECF subfamily)
VIPSDAQLLQRSAAGDGPAFEVFVGRHEASVFRYLRTLTRVDLDAEDALQDAFVAAWRGAAGFRGEDSARSWLLSIARHALHRLHRRRVGEPESLLSIDDLGLRADWGVLDSPLDRLAEREDRERLARALAALPEAERETLVLRDLEELSGDEVARMTGVTLAAMKSRLHRARLHLAAVLREECHG